MIKKMISHRQRYHIIQTYYARMIMRHFRQCFLSLQVLSLDPYISPEKEFKWKGIVKYLYHSLKIFPLKVYIEFISREIEDKL